METPPLSPLDMIDRRFVTFVMKHTHSLGDAAKFLVLNIGTLKERRVRYGIPTPPKGHYQGPKLSPEEMVRAFFASMVAAPPVFPIEQLMAWLHSASVTFVMPGTPARTFALSRLLPVPPQSPPSGGARLAQ